MTSIKRGRASAARGAKAQEPNWLHKIGKAKAASGAWPEAKGVDGWSESDVEEIVERLEPALFDSAEARRRGALGALTIAPCAWAAFVRNLKRTLGDVKGRLRRGVIARRRTSWARPHCPCLRRFCTLSR